MASLFSVLRLVKLHPINSLCNSFSALKITRQSTPLISASQTQNFSRNLQTTTPKCADVPLPTQPDMSASSLFKVTEKAIEQDVQYDKYGKPIEREYKFSTKNFKISLQRISLLANQLSGLDINQAILQMEFSQKRAAKKLVNVLAFARKNAQLQLNFDPERMYIHQAWVGKGNYIKGLIDIKGRGRFGIKEHPFCHMKFIFREKPAITVPTVPGMNERRKIRGFRIRRNVWVAHKEHRALYSPKPFYNW